MGSNACHARGASERFVGMTGGRRPMMPISSSVADAAQLCKCGACGVDLNSSLRALSSDVSHCSRPRSRRLFLSKASLPAGIYCRSKMLVSSVVFCFVMCGVTSAVLFCPGVDSFHFRSVWILSTRLLSVTSSCFNKLAM